MTAPDVVAFHLGMVVRDTEATIEMFRKAVGAQTWKTRMFGSPEAPIKMTYGGGPGHIAYELFEVLGPGSSMFHIFLEEHGEGVQHIGYWTPDLRASVEAALAAGGRLMNLQADQRSAVAQVAPGEVDLDKLGPITFVNPGLAGVRLEFAGPMSGQGLRDWLGADFDKIIAPPPW
jgi:catechol 2,3-dioxygenase-like lactoylglutathione lyase family enzyme